MCSSVTGGQRLPRQTAPSGAFPSRREGLLGSGLTSLPKRFPLRCVRVSFFRQVSVCPSLQDALWERFRGRGPALLLLSEIKGKRDRCRASQANKIKSFRSQNVSHFILFYLSTSHTHQLSLPTVTVKHRLGHSAKRVRSCGSRSEKVRSSALQRTPWLRAFDAIATTHSPLLRVTQITRA